MSHLSGSCGAYTARHESPDLWGRWGGTCNQIAKMDDTNLIKKGLANLILQRGTVEGSGVLTSEKVRDLGSRKHAADG
jgi:hypothetical protein